jgi:hypothetical protein
MDNELLAKLKLIGKLKQNEKLNVKKMFIQPDNIISKISRSLLFVDDRENTLNFIQNTLEKCFEFMETKEKNNPRLDNILIDLSDALEGIKTLKTTYSTDVFFCCKIDVLVQEIEIKIKQYQSAQN